MNIYKALVASIPLCGCAYDNSLPSVSQISCLADIESCISGDWKLILSFLSSAFFHPLIVIAIMSTVFTLYVSLRYIIIRRLEFRINRNMEYVKANLESMIDKSVKVNEIQFKVIPDTWGKLYDAWIKMTLCNAVFDTNSVTVMSQSAFEEYMRHLELEPYIIEELRHSTNRNNDLLRAINCSRIAKAKKAIFDFRDIINSNSIFIEKEIVESMHKLYNMLNAACNEYDNSLRVSTPNCEMMEALLREGNEIVKSIQVELRNWFNICSRIKP